VGIVLLGQTNEVVEAVSRATICPLIIQTFLMSDSAAVFDFLSLTFSFFLSFFFIFSATFLSVSSSTVFDLM